MRSVTKSLILLATSAIACLLLLEAALRLSGRVAVEGLHTVSAEDHERIPGWWEPGQDLIDRRNPALAHRVRINALGLRGPETSLRPDRPRILCLGDSFTFGDFVDEDGTLPARLQARLGDEIEVLNGGVSGTTIVDQRVLLERLLVLEPSLVLVIFSYNDLSDLGVEPAMHELLARNRELKSGALGPVYGRLRDTALFNALLHVRGRLRTREMPDVAAGPGRADAALGELVERYAAEAARVKALLDARDVGLVFAGMPSHRSVERKTPQDRFAAVEEALAPLGVPFVNLVDPIRNSGLRLDELYLLPHDGHTSALGNDFAASVIAPVLRRELAGG